MGGRGRSVVPCSEAIGAVAAALGLDPMAGATPAVSPEAVAKVREAAASDPREAMRQVFAVGDPTSGPALELGLAAISAMASPKARIDFLKNLYGRAPEVPARVASMGLMDADPEVASMVAKELVPLVHVEGGQILLDGATNESLDGRVRCECLRTLAKGCPWLDQIGPVLFGEAVQKLTLDTNPHVRREALNTLVTHDPMRAANVLGYAVADFNYYVRANALSHLTKGVGDPSLAVAGLCGDFQKGPTGSSPRSNSMHKALYAKVVNLAVDVLATGTPMVIHRYAANLALDHDFRGEERLASAVMARLTSDKGELEGLAAWAGQHRSQDGPAREGSLEVDLARFFNTDPVLKDAYIRAMTATTQRVDPAPVTPTKAVVPIVDPMAAIMEGFKNGDPAFRKKCVEALRESGAPHAEWAKVLDAALKDVDAGVRGVGYASLVARNQEADRTTVGEGIRDESPLVRLEVAKAIVRHGAEAHRDTLMGYLKGTENTSSLKSVINLIRRSPQGAPLLAELQRRPASRLRIALEELGLRRPIGG